MEKIKIKAVTETFLNIVNIDIRSEYDIDDFRFFNKDRIGRRRGGVALYVAWWFNPLETTLVDNNVEHVCVKTKWLNVSVTYRPPGQIHEQDAEMYHILRQTLTNSESITSGNFNLPHIDWQNCSGVESKSHRMIQFIENNFLHQLVTE